MWFCWPYEHSFKTFHIQDKTWYAHYECAGFQIIHDNVLILTHFKVQFQFACFGDLVTCWFRQFFFAFQALVCSASSLNLAIASLISFLCFQQYCLCFFSRMFSFFSSIVGLFSLNGGFSVSVVAFQTHSLHLLQYFAVFIF